MAKKLNCWETLKCNKLKCPAYNAEGNQCWLISGTYCHDSIQGEFLNKIDLCLKCKVFNQNITIPLAKESIKVLSNQLKDYSNKLIKHKNKLQSINKKLALAIKEANTSAKMFRDIIDFFPDATLVIDSDKRVVAWNKAMEKLTGVKKAEIMGKGDYAYSVPFYGYKRPILIDLLNASDEEIEKQYGFIQRSAFSIIGEVYIPSFNKGKGVYLWAIASPIFNKDGIQIGAIESIRDITEYKETENMLTDINEKLRLWANNLEQTTRDLSVLNEVGERMQLCANIEDAYAVISETMQKLLPSFSGCLYTLNDSKDMLVSVIKWGESLRSKETFKPSQCKALKDRRLYIAEINKNDLQCSHLSKGFLGNIICIHLFAQNESLGLVHLQIEKDQSAFSEIELSESRQLLIMTLAEHISLSLYNIKLREELKYQAIRDPLTGLFNRRYMEETLARELQRANRKNSTVGLIIFDIDHFKRFNDTFGHAAGDTMLREIASFIKSHIRMEDIASRYGGEEFLITMPDASLETTKERAEKLRQEVKKLIVLYHQKPLGVVTLSFGVAVYPTHAHKGEALIKAADKALYRAKAEGRDRVVVAE